MRAHFPMLLAALFAIPVSAAEGDRILLDETIIAGNQELPKVLYVLPWRELPGDVPAATPPDHLAAVPGLLLPHEHRAWLEHLDALEAAREPGAGASPDPEN